MMFEQNAEFSQNSCCREDKTCQGNRHWQAGWDEHLGLCLLQWVTFVTVPGCFSYRLRKGTLGHHQELGVSLRVLLTQLTVGSLPEEDKHMTRKDEGSSCSEGLPSMQEVTGSIPSTTWYVPVIPAPMRQWQGDKKSRSFSTIKWVQHHPWHMRPCPRNGRKGENRGKKKRKRRKGEIGAAY